MENLIKNALPLLSLKFPSREMDKEIILNSSNFFLSFPSPSKINFFSDGLSCLSYMGRLCNPSADPFESSILQLLMDRVKKGDSEALKALISYKNENDNNVKPTQIYFEYSYLRAQKGDLEAIYRLGLLYFGIWV